MGFLGDLANSISQQFSLGQNTTTSLDAVVDGQQTKFGSLGDFASQFDQSAERRYLEEGYLRRDPYNTDPKQLEVLWQQPNATVLVKKRMFSSIGENYRPDFMDADEKLFYKAMNVLFQNKCVQIAALEQLSKIQKITAAVGNISAQLVPVIITMADIANNGYASGSNTFAPVGGSTQDAGSFFQVVDRLRTLYAFNQTATYTTWLTDTSNLYQSTFGMGNGVIEITNFTNLTTNVGIDMKSPGNFSLSISDPYESMLITDYDIEVALSDASNIFYNSKAFQFGTTSINQVITQQQAQLNAARAARGASSITFQTNPQTLLGQPLTTIINATGTNIPFTYDPTGGTGIPGLGGFGNSVTVPDDYLRGGAVAGYNGLDNGTTIPIGNGAIKPLVGSTELSLYQAIVVAVFQQLQLLANSSNGFTTNNHQYNYARKKLRFNFSGKLIIQPMDVVHIYMSSKSQFDNKILAGLQQMFTGFGILQNITQTATSIKTASDTLFNPSGNIAIQAEKSIYAGPDFPNYLWALLRPQFVTEIEGAHVFAGVVDHAVDRWSDGKFTISVDGRDNTMYWEQGKINFKPGADNFNGLMFDPLTPFKSNFDTITTNGSPTTVELLDENKYLLSDTGAGSLVKYKQGSMAGQKATSSNYIQDQHIDPGTGRLTRVYYAPDGLVYRWKQGIGVFTQQGSTATINDPNLVGVPSTTFVEPFAGLDVMNVLSLLITGVPYNYATFFQASQNLGGFENDPQSKQSSAHSYLNSLRANLTKANTLWGNFIPFKGLTMNESAIAQAMQAQFTATHINSNLDANLKQFANLQTSLAMLGAVNALSTNVPTTADATTASQVSQLQSQVTNLQTSINTAIGSLQSETRQLFNQVDTSASYDSNYLIDGKNNPADSKARKTLRRQINQLTRRMSYDVRANRDKSLFIVDDYYDVDYDIAAFNSALDGIPLYSTEFTSVKSKIQHVADLLDLEVFCDTQGHIRVRSPQYNRMPSSVFYRMLYLKQTLGIQIFPQFLNNLFTDQINSLRTQIEIVEDQIRLNCAILGHYPSLDLTGDQMAADFIVDSNVTGGQNVVFAFFSDSTDTITDIQTLTEQANQDASSGNNQSSFGQAATQTKQVFSNAERYTVLYNALQAQNQTQGGTNPNNQPTTSVFQSSVVQQLITRINTKSGSHIVAADYLTQAGPNQPIVVGSNQTVDVFKVTQELQNQIQAWQKAAKNFYHAIKNAAEAKSLDNGTTSGNALSTPGIFNNSYIPEVYEHMIEDETYDDYGIGSGTRYVIHNSQIKELSISENPPPWTSVQVQGTLSPLFSEENGGGGPAEFGTFPGGGNGLVTAQAIDYDMWRNYGYKEPNVIRVPFFNDPVTQCGPYASMVLNRNRSNILQGTCTIAGNEYMQPGEVIYLETRNLLFYVKSVRHNMTMGGSFTTSLDLIYGHSIGEYIPTFLDTVGKLFYKNQDPTNTIIQRQDSSMPEQNLGVIQIDGKNPTLVPINTGSEDNQTDPYSVSNATVINNILAHTSYVTNANGQPGNNVTATVELRLYYNKAAGGVNTALSNVASTVRGVLTGSMQGPVNSPSTNQPVQNRKLPSSAVKIVTVNLDDLTDPRSPSQQAIDAARNQVANTSTNQGTPNPSNPIAGNTNTNASAINANNVALGKTLFSYIVDCWVTFTQVPSTVTNGSSSAPPS